MREISLREVLDARERRAWKQQELLREFRRPVLSFTMNIPGPVKDSPLIRRGFDEGLRLLDKALEKAGFVLLSREELREPTGCELLCAAEAEAAALKALCQEIEESSPLGRLFDLDVIGPDGQKLTRKEERRCLVCGAKGRGCASRRLHSLAELDAAVKKLLRGGLLDADGRDLDALATRALLDEVDTTPKPGLVDRNNNGSHRDMTPETFRASALALRGYWKDCFLLGARTAAEAPETAFVPLRSLGLDAEARMLRATKGVNTHKGAIFTLGTLCAAIGRTGGRMRPAGIRRPSPRRRRSFAPRPSGQTSRRWSRAERPAAREKGSISPAAFEASAGNWRTVCLPCCRPPFPGWKKGLPRA